MEATEDRTCTTGMMQLLKNKDNIFIPEIMVRVEVEVINHKQLKYVIQNNLGYGLSAIRDNEGVKLIIKFKGKFTFKF